MKTCKNCKNKILAKGLCRSHYDSLPENIAKRSKSTLTAHKFASYRNTKEFEAYAVKFKETEEYKKWQLEKWKFISGQTKRKTNITSASLAEYKREYYKKYPEKYKQQLKTNLERYHKKKAGDSIDSTFETRGINRPINTQVPEKHERHNSRSQGAQISLQE